MPTDVQSTTLDVGSQAHLSSTPSPFASNSATTRAADASDDAPQPITKRSGVTQDRARGCVAAGMVPVAWYRVEWYTKSHSRILNPDSCPLRIYRIHIESVDRLETAAIESHPVYPGVQFFPGINCYRGGRTAWLAGCMAGCPRCTGWLGGGHCVRGCRRSHVTLGGGEGEEAQLKRRCPEAASFSVVAVRPACLRAGAAVVPILALNSEKARSFQSPRPLGHVENDDFDG